MYKNPNRNQIKFTDFILPFGGKLNGENRWVKLSEMIPWDSIEDEYATLFGDTGNPAKSCRIALGALLAQEKLSATDEEITLQATENPYIQYFLGFTEYTVIPPFAESSLVNFRKRFPKETLAKINEEIFIGKSNDNADNDGTPPNNSGTLILDAVCAPADITYPTDLDLLNEAREKTEEMIDTLHKPNIGKMKKPRTYRRKARKAYLKIAKSRKKQKKTIRKGIREQLGFVRRNLETIGTYDNSALSKRQKKLLETIKTLYEQQNYMYENKTHSVADRICSISQPWVRPMVRGKKRADVEFGAKVAISIVNKYAFVDEINWDSFNEGVRLQEYVENYKRRFGHYPAEVIADKLYRNSANIAFCKEHGIRLSGPKLGRPSKNHK